MNTIYKITNRVTNKVYIGLTTQGLKQRQREHFCRFNRCDRDHKLYQSMHKHGFNSFKFEEVCSVLDATDLGKMEQLFIKEYDSYQKGYNMTIGGEVIAQETKEKLSKIFKGRKITWYDKILKSRATNTLDKTRKYHLLKHGETEIVVHNLAQFCKDNNLDQSNLHHSKHNGKAHKGYLLLESSTTSSFERRD